MLQAKTIIDYRQKLFQKANINGLYDLFNLKLPKLKKVGDDKPTEPTKMKLPKLKRV